jgi:hypothetical protein
MRFAIPLMTGLMATTLLAGCATTPASVPVEVTRYRVDNVGRGSIVLAPEQDYLQGSDYRIYADAIGHALEQQGYTLVPDGGRGDYVARIAIDTQRRASSQRSPVSIGLGAGGFSGNRGGGGVGLGGGVSFPIGRGRVREQVATTLSVKIVTREGGGVWEGHAAMQDIRPVGANDIGVTATKLATALFTGFPGESGRTIEVK